MTVPARYARILSEIKRLEAKMILEVGTWNGDRAVEMMKAAMQNGFASYYGFDLFQDMTPEKSELEFNVKAPSSFESVSEKLRKNGLGRNSAYTLIKGDTRDTLPTFFSQMGRGSMDLAWIDGGHSIATITSDWTWCRKMIRPGGVVLLDDYYSEMAPGFVDQFGCNGLVAAITGELGNRISIFPEKDPVKGGGFVQIVKVQL